MNFLKSTLSLKIIILLTSLFFLQNCGIYRPTDAREVSPNAKDRVEKNIKEGRGFQVLDRNKRQGGVFEFASSNPMWRATIDLLDFAPFSNVDYSGGIIITDWYSNDDSDQNENLKITVRFLSNEIRSDGLDVIVPKKTCDQANRCKITKLETDLTDEIKIAILKNATKLEEFDIANSPNKDYILREPKN